LLTDPTDEDKSMLYSKADLEAGTKLMEEMFKAMAAEPTGDQMELDDDDGEAQLQSIKSCFEKYIPQLEGNPWCRNILESL
jgi:DNA mismatch repair protein MSH2